MIIEYSARSHVGMVRENNEDNLYVDGIALAPNVRECPFAIDGTTSFPAIFAVCDGIGGEENGEVASLLAIQTLMNFDRRIKEATSESFGDIIQLYVNEVGAAIHLEPNNAKKRTGTTLALAAISKNGVYCFNLGDSRIYSLQRSAFRQITNDHTLAAEQMKNGFSTKEQAEGAKNLNKLTRCIGIGDMPIVEKYPPIIGKCRILICSDGLTDMVSASEIENILRASERTADAANSLLSSTLENGGQDNVTVIIIDMKASKRSFFRSLVKKLKG